MNSVVPSLQKWVVSTAYQSVANFRKKYSAKRNPVENVAYELTDGDPTFIKLRDRYFKPLAIFLLRIGLTPNSVSLLGLLFAFSAALSVGETAVFSVLIFLNLICDGIDGVMARLSGKNTDFGSILDVSCDTLSVISVAIGLMIAGQISFVVGLPYILIVLFYTARSATKNKILSSTFLSVGSRILAFAGLLIITLSFSAITVPWERDFFVTCLFGAMSSVLAGAYMFDVLRTRL